ncbi:MAG TPA: hypothetical protein VF746_11680 [Longimicrobium sp.]|jgi:hypothetical protein
MERIRPRPSWWKWAALGAALVMSGLLVGCCSRSRLDLGPPHRAPLPSALVIPTPDAARPAASDTITEASMRNVALHVDDDVRLRIRQLRGRMHDLSGQHVVLLDDKNAIRLDVAYGEMAISGRDLSILLNRYVFGYPGSPLRDLVVSVSNGQLVQRGVLHKVVDLPFEMTATLSVADGGRVRIHPTRLKICDVDGFGLLRAVRSDLESLVDLSGARGVEADGNDLLLDPIVIIPPPKIAGLLTAARIEGQEVVMVFGSAGAPGAGPLAPAVPASNYVYFRGGTLRMGKLFMPQADLEAIDGDESDPFDFYLDYYHSQLVAGYHMTRPNYALVAWMPDFDDLGTPAAHLGPPPLPHG